MLTKQQKKEEVSADRTLIAGSANLIFADFTGVPTLAIHKLKTALKASGAKYRVIRKRLFAVALKEQGIEFDPLQFSAQFGVVFVPSELGPAASAVYKFSKELLKDAKKEFKVLGAYDTVSRAFVPVAQFNVIAQLPSREVLLGQVVGTMIAPLKAFMNIVDQLAKREVAPQN